MEKHEAREHTLTLLDRKRMTLTGVLDVSEFSETQVILKTSLGGLCIKGSALSISKLDTDNGTLDVGGEIREIRYMNKSGGKFLAGLLK